MLQILTELAVGQVYVPLGATYTLSQLTILLHSVSIGMIRTGYSGEGPVHTIPKPMNCLGKPDWEP